MWPAGRSAGSEREAASPSGLDSQVQEWHFTSSISNSEASETGGGKWLHFLMVRTVYLKGGVGWLVATLYAAYSSDQPGNGEHGL